MRGVLEGGNKDEIKAYRRSIISRIEVGESLIRTLGDRDTLTDLVEGNASVRQDEHGRSNENEVLKLHG